jgi:hypothetical protein
VDWYEFINVSEVCTVSIIRAMMEALQTSEMMINSYLSTQHYNPEDGYLHSHLYENLTSLLHTVLQHKQQR